MNHVLLHLLALAQDLHGERKLERKSFNLSV